MTEQLNKGAWQQGTEAKQSGHEGLLATVSLSFPFVVSQIVPPPAVLSGVERSAKLTSIISVAGRLVAGGSAGRWAVCAGA